VDLDAKAVDFDLMPFVTGRNRLWRWQERYAGFTWNSAGKRSEKEHEDHHPCLGLGSDFCEPDGFRDRGPLKEQKTTTSTTYVGEAFSSACARKR